MPGASTATTRARPTSRQRSTPIEGLRVERDGALARIEFDRVERRNAISTPMWAALPGILAELEADARVRIIIVSGAGGTFSAGSDIEDLPGDLETFWSLNTAALEALARVRVPTIAAVEGAAIGGGTELAAACDIRVGTPDSRYGITAARLGVVYPAGASRHLAELIGPGRAKHLLLTGEIIDAETACRFGIIDEIVDDSRARAEELAALMVVRSQLSQHAALRALAGEELPAPALQAHAGAELAEGRAAFAERRRPAFAFERSAWPGTPA